MFISHFYWIQGFRDKEWHNLHSCNNRNDVLTHINVLIRSNNYQELRLNKASFPADDGETIYTELAVVRNGEILSCASQGIRSGLHEKIKEGAPETQELSSDAFIESNGSEQLATNELSDIQLDLKAPKTPDESTVPKTAHPFGSPNTDGPSFLAQSKAKEFSQSSEEVSCQNKESRVFFQRHSQHPKDQLIEPEQNLFRKYFAILGSLVIALVVVVYGASLSGLTKDNLEEVYAYIKSTFVVKKQDLSTNVSDLKQDDNGDSKKRSLPNREKPDSNTIRLTSFKSKSVETKIPQDLEIFEQELFDAIEANNLKRIQHLLLNRPELVQLDTVTRFISDKFATGYRSAVDHSLLSGKYGIALGLMNAGMVPSTKLFHQAVSNYEQPDMRIIANFLVKNGSKINTFYDGLTVLMRAAFMGDRKLVTLMLTHGANPSAQTKMGMTAAEFAAMHGDKRLHELLVFRAEAQKYDEIMLGFSWFDNVDSVRHKAKKCQKVDLRYLICTVKSNGWLRDIANIEAQFDSQARNRLVAIKIKSKPLRDETPNGIEARRRFEQVLKSIKVRLPRDHIGVASRQVPKTMSFWKALNPNVNAGQYIAYWSDDDKRRPVFIYLKLQGDRDKEGHYKIIIGNPFRVS
ncbi:MAG: ankyrin repeat domain-containing protein [Pseudomonadota bacterium]|nr:ankyrin repeat domain-containing protein [Pseudomonadota bacterium]